MKIRLPAGEKLNLIGNISTMLTAGIPILEAVESLLEEAKGNQKKILTQLSEDLVAGKNISTSFTNFPYIFDKVSINLIKASEEAGTLETTLKDLKSTIEEEIEFSDKIKSALFYPMVVMGVFALVLLMMLVVVIPKMATVFKRMKIELPLPTKILIFASDALINYSWLVIGGIVLLAGGIYFLYNQNKELIFRIAFSLPLVSLLMRKIDATRFSRSMHLLLASGIPINNSLELAEDVLLKKEMREMVSKARQLAVGGRQFSEGLRNDKNLFPRMMVKLMEVGEKTGTLENSMQQVATHMDYEVSKTLKKLTMLLEPLMLVFVGIAVGAMMLAIIAPIYGLIGQVGG